MNMNLDAIRNGVSLPKIVGKLPKVPVASAVSGLIVAALILMTPNPWFEAFIVETGLPGVLTAAEPPLGARARIVFALIAALIVTIGAWAALTAILGRKSHKRTEDQFEYPQDEREHENPRIRRADSHPDAPYRRPIMAGDEMGIPLDLVTVAADENAYDDEASDILELEEVAELDEEFAEPFEAEAYASEEDGPEEFPQTEPADHIAEHTEPVFEISLPRRDTVVEDVSPEPIEPEEEPQTPAAAVSPSEIKSDLADLVARLEAGLERKRANRDNKQNDLADAPHENVTAHPQAQPRSVADHDSALRDALNALQKVSGKAS
jgi:hypothetical protein